MTIKAFCCFYNEAPLIPFFLSHYHYVDAIHACVSQSIDGTRELLAADPRVTIEDVEFTAGFDDDEKIGWLNRALARHAAAEAWALVLDADEFIWPGDDVTGDTAKAYLASVPGRVGVLWARMEQVYRHADDVDLDLSRTPVVYQRRHGIHGYGGDLQYQKPSVVRTSLRLTFDVGHHRIVGCPPISKTHLFHGAHWQNADAWAITRRVRDRKERLSANNLAKGHGTQHWTMTADDVRRELESHRHDAQLF